VSRCWLALGLFLEAAVLALLAVAVVHGRFDQGPGFFGVLLGGLLAGSTVATWVLPGRLAGQAVTHGALLTGCVVFAFPFVWLVGTSLKYDEEIFVYPPRWVPAVPRKVEISPYLTAESLPPLQPPEGLAADRWPGLWSVLQPLLLARGQALLEARTAEVAGASPAAPAFARALYQTASAGLPRSGWAANDSAIAAAVVDRLDRPSVAVAWETVHRSLALRRLTVVNEARDLHPPSATDRPDPWAPCEGSVQVQADPGKGADGVVTVAYDLRQSARAGLAVELPLPVSAERFLGVILPIRQDRTWHRLHVTLELAGRRYEAADPLYLGQYRWQELTFKLAERDPRDERDLGIWPLVPAADQSSVLDRPDRFRLVLTVERASRAIALWRKYTANFRGAWIATQHRWRYVGNSLYLATLTILGQILSCSLVAYAFARLRWPGRDLLFGLLLATMMLPGQVTMIPVFMVFRELGWYNTLRPLWVPSFLGSAFFIFMLRQFMRSIPVDLEEAARIDGCSRFGIYWRIILPLVKPALAAVGIFTFMGTWNDFMGPLIYVNDQRLYPLALGLFDFRTQHGSEFGLLMAASTLMTAPVIALFFAAQRYFIQGVTLTGIKG
jgi:ABC-type glycerol-3-phosphate transport system permease component